MFLSVDVLLTPQHSNTNQNIAMCHIGVFADENACLGRVVMRRRKTMMMNGWNQASEETAGGETETRQGGAD